MKSWIIGIGILVVSAIGYAYLGGFNEVAIKEHDSKKIKLQGIAFQGDAKHSMGTLFSYADSVLKATDSEEELSAYFYNAASEENNYQVKVFVGATINGGKVLDDKFEVKEFDLGECLSSQQTSNPIFTKVYRSLFSEAEQMKITLDSSIVLEQYPKEDSMVIWVPVVARN